MRTPSHRRPRRRVIDRDPVADLAAVATAVTYVGSAEHKDYPSPAGPPRLRVDATKCDPQLHNDFDLLTDWLRQGIRSGCVGAPWEDRFPRYVWVIRDQSCFEARLVNAGTGEYKGYQLLDSEWPQGMPHD